MDWKDAQTQLLHLGLAMLGVILMALLQSTIDAIRVSHPEVIAAGTQTAAAFGAIKLLGAK